jgi:4-hydroxy-2-oxoheptanedioate aldolase
VISLPDVALAELTASFVDFVWIDLEHGALSARDVQPLAVAARAAGAESFVRLGSASDAALGRAIDAGVDGVVVPRVESAGDAEGVVERLRRPPRGSRGMAVRRAASYGRDRLLAEPRCVVQIESEAGATEAERIAALDGVHALVVGCADLAADTGEKLDAGAPRLREAIARVRAACADAGLAFGLAGPDNVELVEELGSADVAILGADVRIYSRALGDLFEPARSEARVCA